MRGQAACRDEWEDVHRTPGPRAVGRYCVSQKEGQTAIFGASMLVVLHFHIPRDLMTFLPPSQQSQAGI
ncbi:hypothetical protein N7468_005468 [Penicillium chermesinum]|uniref:Uncharacterized protein n=1 Tax=Penicillium chermesinum TaxID=63820 RepID=A0A9W9P1P4_9EURO|nr:uncharacterized protein N7468_005468 [Penicillium chermesinum]KAJ5232512.1 hypothetical protein N7468_005468 [Penicillium chermesinum]